MHGSDVLTTLEYRIAGTGLQVSPPAVSVPGIAGSVLVTLVGGEAAGGQTNGTYVEAFCAARAFLNRGGLSVR